MKTLRKDIEFVGGKQSWYHESFENYKEFYDVVSRQENAHKKNRRCFLKIVVLVGLA